MKQSQADNWRDRCYGREELLGELFEAYRQATGGSPQFVVLLGMTGIGKTRLAQELYRWLTREHDAAQPAYPQGYWPDYFFDELTKDDVNPEPDNRPRPPIPFLWWGIKFREDHVAAEALYQSLPYLSSHAVQAIVRRGIKRVHGDWLWKIINLGLVGLGLIPGVGLLANIPGWVKDGFELWKGTSEKQQLRRLADEPVGDTRRREERQWTEQVVNTLRLFLDSSQTDAPTIPVVLFLDDSHWADPLTLQAVRQLWSEAQAKGWPLLIVATHWDDEWHLHRQERTAAEQSPRRLADLLDCLAPEPRDRMRLLPVCGVAEGALREWTVRTLPGLTAEQRGTLLDKASAAAIDAAGNSIPGGSPRVLECLMQWLLEEPADCFERADASGPLLPGTLEVIRTQIHDLHDIIEQRFRRLDREVKKALGWSSLQGRRFLAEVTAAVAERVAVGLTSDAIRAGLQRAHLPHLWIDPVGRVPINPGRLNLCDFRSNIFHEIARQHFSKNMAEIAAVDAAVADVLQAWLLAGRLDPPEDPELLGPDDLTVAERRDALRMAVARFRPTEGRSRADEQWRAYGAALARLVKLDVSGHLWGDPLYWEQAETTAIEFAQARPSGWPAELVGLYWQVEVVDVLWRMRELELAASLLQPLHGQLGTLAGTSDRRGRRDLALVCERLGVVRQMSGRRGSALDLYLESLSLSRGIVTEFGRSPEALRDVSVSLNKVADAMRGLGVGHLEVYG
ncbi:MAG: AAA family ATPase [Pirellulaceae bacterium]|nr:AAA family ATPase [Pirellulaceae bacterium]